MTYTLEKSTVGIIGLGYVGMPLALMLAKNVPTLGFDLFERRISELQSGWDSNREIKQSELRTTNCKFTNNIEDLKSCNVFIITVPTPLDSKNNPDLTAVKSASESIGKILKKGDVVVYESTVYPGVTEDICGPILESNSGLTCGVDFFLGYSPERINPGDTKHTVQNITKVVAGQTEEITSFLAKLYGSINNDNIFQAKNIKTAEASKAIENAQRDINVAFVNEITIILDKLGLSSYDVLEAAKTKWNFLNFYPGLVGGHCIGVDPYYFAHCAEEQGYSPEVILSGRRTNDSMGLFIADKIHETLKDEISTSPKRILLLGFTFKENINDIRNTKVIDIYHALIKAGHHVDIHDPFARLEDVKNQYNISLLESLSVKDKYDCVGLMVGHNVYEDMTAASVESLLNPNHGTIYDIKGMWRDTSFSSHYVYKTL
ncbi:MAG: nucleotide sugar dehydrogenase [Alphaproteobacteria bacterium]